MKVTLIHVLSLDGKLTKGLGENIYEWSSTEDFKNFTKVRNSYKLLIMGSGTFDGVKDNKAAGLKPEKERLRIILTSRPKEYEKYVVPGQMEFSGETPKNLIKRMEKLGFTEMLLVSGGKVATSFFKENLIEELLMTIEPRIFGRGEPLVQDEQFDVKLQLLSLKQLNKQGTILLHYKVIT